MRYVVHVRCSYLESRVLKRYRWSEIRQEIYSFDLEQVFSRIRKFPCHCINREFFDNNNYPLDVPSVGGCSVSPFFPRRFVPPRLPGSGSAETHFPSEERKNDATSIDQNRMTPREKSSLEIEHARGKCFFFLSLSLSASHAPPTRRIPLCGLPSVVRVKWFFVGLVPVAIVSRWLRSPIERNSWNRVSDKGVWYMGRI